MIAKQSIKLNDKLANRIIHTIVAVIKLITTKGQCVLYIASGVIYGMLRAAQINQMFTENMN
jgi:hypothetical protein